MTRLPASALPLAALAACGEPGAPPAGSAPETAPLGLVIASIPEVPGAALVLRGCGIERPVAGGEAVELALPPQDCALKIYAERWDTDAFGASAPVSIRAGEASAVAPPAPPDDAWQPLSGEPTPTQGAQMDALEVRWIAIEDAIRALPGGCPEAAALEAMGAADEVAAQLAALEERDPFLLPSQAALAAQIEGAVRAASEACAADAGAGGDRGGQAMTPDAGSP